MINGSFYTSDVSCQMVVNELNSNSTTEKLNAHIWPTSTTAVSKNTDVKCRNSHVVDTSAMVQSA